MLSWQLNFKPNWQRWEGVPTGGWDPYHDHLIRHRLAIAIDTFLRRLLSSESCQSGCGFCVVDRILYFTVLCIHPSPPICTVMILFEETCVDDQESTASMKTAPKQKLHTSVNKRLHRFEYTVQWKKDFFDLNAKSGPISRLFLFPLQLDHCCKTILDWILLPEIISTNIINLLNIQCPGLYFSILTLFGFFEM